MRSEMVQGFFRKNGGPTRSRARRTDILALVCFVQQRGCALLRSLGLFGSNVARFPRLRQGCRSIFAWRQEQSQPGRKLATNRSTLAGWHYFANVAGWGLLVAIWLGLFGSTRANGSRNLPKVSWSGLEILETITD